MKIKIILIALIALYFYVGGQTVIPITSSNLGLYDQLFIENKGQWDPDVLFFCRADGCDIWITKHGLNCLFYQIKNQEGSSELERLRTNPKWGDSLPLVQKEFIGHRILLTFHNINSNLVAEGSQKVETYFNFFTGSDSTKHVTKAGVYKEVAIKNIFDGIDVHYFFKGDTLHSRFIIRSDAKSSDIKFNLTGQVYDNIKGNKLFLKLSFKEIPFLEWNVLQDQQNMTCELKKSVNEYLLIPRSYENDKSIQVDLTFSPLRVEHSIVLRDIHFNNGSLYLCGHGLAIMYGSKIGSFTLRDGKFYDTYVLKMNSVTRKIEFATFIGGDDQEEGNALTIDKNGNIYVTGISFSKNFPVTAFAFQKKLVGFNDIFLTKLNSTGSQILFSSYAGGGFNDEANDIVVDGSGNIYLTGITTSWNFPVTTNAFQPKHQASFADAFLIEFNPENLSIDYATYLGGVLRDDAMAMAVDKNGRLYVVGKTQAEDFLVTPNAYQKQKKSYGDDIFLTVFADNHQVLYSTFLGGSGDDVPLDMFVDDSGYVYVGGYTSSLDFPIFGKCFQEKFGGGEYDGFCIKFHLEKGLVSSTFIGGEGNDRVTSLKENSQGEILLTGHTSSSNLVAILKGGQRQKTKGKDVFVLKTNSNFSEALYTDCLDFEKVDVSAGMVLDLLDRIFILVNSHPTSNF
ncbi:MAG: SBBP repeat-containing protein [Bacteroidales bacterium]|nr:SBBP repeat-containing protein [Bacteroidales bacterium]